MPDQTSLEIAIGGHQQVPEDWMPASQVGPFILEDPALVWLEYHGAAHGFEPDSSPYEFGDFIAEKAGQFEEKWLAEMALRGSQHLSCESMDSGAHTSSSLGGVRSR